MKQLLIVETGDNGNDVIFSMKRRRMYYAFKYRGKSGTCTLPRGKKYIWS